MLDWDSELVLATMMDESMLVFDDKEAALRALYTAPPADAAAAAGALRSPQAGSAQPPESSFGGGVPVTEASPPRHHAELRGAARSFEPRYAHGAAAADDDDDDDAWAVEVRCRPCDAACLCLNEV